MHLFLMKQLLLIEFGSESIGNSCIRIYRLIKQTPLSALLCAYFMTNIVITIENELMFILKLLIQVRYGKTKIKKNLN